MLVSTVGPFTKWGEPAVRAAITGHAAAYIDSTGEPAFIRRVFQNHGPVAEQAGVPLLTAMGYDFVPGALAGALALEEAGEDAVRVDVGYYALGMTTQSGSAGTRASLVGASLGREPRVPRRRAAQRPHGRARALVHGQGQGARGRLGRRRRAPRRCPPRTRGCRRSTSTSAGSARSRGRCRRARWSARSPRRLPGVREALTFAGEQLAALAEGPERRHDARRRVLDRRAGLRRRRAAAGRGPPLRRQLVRVHRRLHRLGGARRGGRAGQGRRRARAGRGVRARGARARLRARRAQPNIRLNSGRAARARPPPGRPAPRRRPRSPAAAASPGGGRAPAQAVERLARGRTRPARAAARSRTAAPTTRSPRGSR